MKHPILLISIATLLHIQLLQYPIEDEDHLIHAHQKVADDLDHHHVQKSQGNIPLHNHVDALHHQEVEGNVHHHQEVIQHMNQPTFRV